MRIPVSRNGRGNPAPVKSGFLVFLALDNMKKKKHLFFLYCQSFYVEMPGSPKSFNFFPSFLLGKVATLSRCWHAHSLSVLKNIYDHSGFSEFFGGNFDSHQDVCTALCQVPLLYSLIAVCSFPPISN